MERKIVLAGDDACIIELTEGLDRGDELGPYHSLKVYRWNSGPDTLDLLFELETSGNGIGEMMLSTFTDFCDSTWNSTRLLDAVAPTREAHDLCGCDDPDCSRGEHGGDEDQITKVEISF